ncbi:hypothetical protein BH10CYA1_BH10CYA1_44980 [soil metagenome]
MRNAILTLVSLVTLSAPALAQDSTDTSGATTTTQSTNTTSTAPTTEKTTTTTRKPAPVAVHHTTTTRHRTRTGVAIRPVRVHRNTVVTPNGSASTTTISH